MKFHLCALFALAVVPAILAEDQSPSLWERIRGHGVGPSLHIGGGSQAGPHTYPHQVMLEISTRPGVGAFCGGSLISPDWVLTAAHCVKNVQGATAVLGAHNRDAKEDYSRQTIRVSEFHLEPNYNTQDTDIALLKLERPAQITQFVKTIRLPSRSMARTDLAGTPAEIIGWGGYADPDTELSTFLRFAPTRVITNDACRRAGWGHGIKDWRICSDGSGKFGICGGDSGGPMVMTEPDGQRTVIGISSFSDAAGCRSGTPSVFTRVSSWIDWINRVTGIPLRN